MVQNPTVALIAHEARSEKAHKAAIYLTNIGLYMYFLSLNQILFLKQKISFSVGKYLTAVKRNVKKYIMLTISSNNSLYLNGILNRMANYRLILYQ